MPEAPWFLHHFDLDTSASERDIKRAYARKLKTFDAGLDAAQFDTLRQAYQQALGWADMKANNPELAQVIWGGESLTPEVADAQPDIAPVDSAAEPAQAVQLETVSTGFDVPADAPWSARAELDSLFSALNVSLNPIKYPLVSDEYEKFHVQLAATVQRLSEADGGLEKSEMFELECLQNAAHQHFKENFTFVKSSELMPILEAQFGWDENALSNRARELDGWAAQRFYALKTELFFIRNLNRYVENPREDLCNLIKVKQIPKGRAFIKWRACASDEGDLKKIRELLDAFERHTTDDSKYINPDVKRFWRTVDPANFTSKERLIAYALNHESAVFTAALFLFFVYILNLLGARFVDEPSFQTFATGTLNFLGLLLAISLLCGSIYFLYILWEKSNIASSKVWLLMKHAPSPIKWFVLWAVLFSVAKFVK